jgi:hypothetical protein
VARYRTWVRPGFAAYERDYTIDQLKIQNNNIPHPSLYTGDFSALKPSAQPLVPSSVTLTPEEIANNTVADSDGNLHFVTIPSRLLNPTVQALINTYFPKIGLAAPINAKNGKFRWLQDDPPNAIRAGYCTLRLDHDSENSHFYGVYNVSSQISATSAVVSPFTGLGLTQNDRRNHTVSLSYAHSFSPSFINEVRGGFNREGLLRHSNTTLESFLDSIGFSQSDIAAYGAVVGPAELSTFGHPQINFSNTFTTFSNGGRNVSALNENLVAFGDTLTGLRASTPSNGGDLVRNGAVDGFAQIVTTYVVR